ncbi:thiaminase II [Bacillus massiliigorillae]|uniref:thiaminase II n=1 Tax=Bacillus massiliigorillae TaxID=1243664 RepID=UPI00039A21F5|nr:thiaminase II [Bacillus massiliigorillae]
MNLTDVLLQQSKQIWNEYLQHPFITEMGNGTLNHKKFEHYLIQDYLYLKEYTKVFCMGVVKSNTIEDMQFFHQAAGGTFKYETAVHIEYLRNFGFSIEDLEQQELELTTESYTSYMHGISLKGDVKEIVAAVLPCVWSYNYIGKHLLENYEIDDNHFYKRWIDSYGREEFTQLSDTWLTYSNRLFADSSLEEQERLIDIFKKASLYELKFWDMAYEEVKEAVK